jgi:hypothetical protein
VDLDLAKSDFDLSRSRVTPAEMKALLARVDGTRRV